MKPFRPPQDERGSGPSSRKRGRGSGEDSGRSWDLYPEASSASDPTCRLASLKLLPGPRPWLIPVPAGANLLGILGGRWAVS